jgi:hypothetical protein
MMKKVKRLWMPLLLGTLLMTTLVGVAGARPNARPEANPQLRDWMIDSSNCVIDSDDRDYDFYSEYARCNAGSCIYLCPIKPPHQGLIRVQRLALYAYDNAAGNVCVYLTQVYPKTASYVDRIVNQCTPDSTLNPQVLALNPANFKVSVLQGLYVWVDIKSGGQKLYGLKLKYEPL